MQGICDYTSSGSEDDESPRKGDFSDQQKVDFRGDRKRSFADVLVQDEEQNALPVEGAKAQITVSESCGSKASLSLCPGLYNSPSRSDEAPVSKVKRYVSKRERKLQEQRQSSQEEIRSAHDTALQHAPEPPTVFKRSQNEPPKRLHLRLEGHKKCVNAVRWSKRHPFLLASCSMDHCIKLWNVNKNKSCLMTLGCHQHAVKDLQWTVGGRHGLSCGYDKTVRLWDAEKGQEFQQFKHDEFVTSVQIHPSDYNIFLSGTFSSGILAWDIRSNQVTLRYEAPFGQVQDLAFINDNEFISTAEVTRRNSVDKGIMVWDLKTTAILSNQIYQEAYTCTGLRVHPHEKAFLAQSSAEYIAIFSTQRPYKLNKYKRFEGHKVSGYRIGFDVSPDGSLVGSGSSDGRVFFYSYQTSKILRSFHTDSTSCSGLAFHPALASTVATCSWAGDILIWE